MARAFELVRALLCKAHIATGKILSHCLDDLAPKIVDRHSEEALGLGSLKLYHTSHPETSLGLAQAESNKTY